MCMRKRVNIVIDSELHKAIKIILATNPPRQTFSNWVNHKINEFVVLNADKVADHKPTLDNKK